ncbi:MAG: tyrosine-type recombinase/integrase [Planctomycetales bacterium]|nr:tyrosine-type recombinase/integrase [Planctomycetales bacterium]
MRISEPMALRWDHRPGGVSVELNGKQSVLVFDAESQKSGRSEAVPLAPEAVELLTPMQRGAGWVFEPMAMRGGVPLARHALKIGKIISDIGKKAGVVTDAGSGRTATAHDLRRANGARWSKRVMPAVLKQLMRHAEIGTTMTYYVQQDARITASLPAESGNTRGNTLGDAGRRMQKTPRN